MVTWYKHDSRRVSLRQLWANSSNLLFFLLAVVILKLFRLRPAADFGVSPDTELEPTALEDMPASAHDSLRAAITECNRHSFRLTNCATLKVLGNLEIYLANLLHAGGKTRCVAVCGRSGKAVNTDCSFISRTQDGVIYNTTNQRSLHDPPPEIRAIYCPGVSIADACSRHEQRLQRLGEQAFVTIMPAQVFEEARALRRRTCEFSIARGLLKPMTQAEIDRLTFVMAELVPDQGDNPFRSPLADEVVTTPRPKSTGKALAVGALFGYAIGGIIELAVRSSIDVPFDPRQWSLLVILFATHIWSFSFALGGAVVGWLFWRRANDRAGASNTPT